MSREQHIRSVRGALFEVAMLREALATIREERYLKVAAAAIEAVGLPASADAPGGAFMSAMETIKEHLDQALFAASLAEQKLTDYERNI